MTNIYYSPEKYGLRTIGEVEWRDYSYEFDLTVVWQDINTGHLFTADDAGCSCPSPFDDIGLNDLTPLADWSAVNHHLLTRLTNERYDDTGERERAVAQIAEIVQRLRDPQRVSPSTDTGKDRP